MMLIKHRTHRRRRATVRQGGGGLAGSGEDGEREGGGASGVLQLSYGCSTAVYSGGGWRWPAVEQREKKRETTTGARFYRARMGL